jgi:hypothetical protein
MLSAVHRARGGDKTLSAQKNNAMVTPLVLDSHAYEAPSPDSKNASSTVCLQAFRSNTHRHILGASSLPVLPEPAFGAGDGKLHWSSNCCDYIRGTGVFFQLKKFCIATFGLA